MDLLELIAQAQGGQAVNQLGRNFGLNQNQTQDALTALLPALAGAVRQNTAAPGGMEALLGALSRGNHSRYLDDPAALPAAADEGNGILGHLFGDKQVSRQVAARASQQTGIGQDVLKQMLPVVASMMMAGLAKQSGRAQASAGGGLGGMLAGTASGQRAPAGGGLLDMLTPLLDQNKDGSAMDDILGMAAKFLRR